MKRTRLFLFWLNLAISLVCILTFINSGADVETLLGWLVQVETFVREQYLVSMLIYSMSLGIAVFYSLPANPLFYLAAGYFFGGIEGAVVSAGAVSAGSYATYLFYRKIFSETNTQQYRQLLPDNPTLLLALLRLSPWFPAPLINIYCDVVKIPSSIFLATTVIASLPLALVYTLISSEVAKNFDLNMVYSGWTGIALCLLGALSIVGLSRPVKIGLEMMKNAISLMKSRPVSRSILLRSN